MALEIDVTGVVPLISVIATSTVTAISMILNVRAQLKSMIMEHEHNLELEKLRHNNQDQDKLRAEQYAILSQMAPYAFDMTSDPNRSRKELYVLALKLLSCSGKNLDLQHRRLFSFHNL